MSWDQLGDIAREAADLARDEQSRPPEACPHDGEPLREGRDGVLFCPWGDYRWPRDGRP